MSGNQYSAAGNTSAGYTQQNPVVGYIAGRKAKRPLAFKQYFGDIDTTMADVVNLDIEADEINLMGQYVDPDVDVYRVQLPGIGNAALSFGYTKEVIGSPNYSEIAQRQLLENPGTFQLTKARLTQAVAQNLAKQETGARNRMENLEELARTNILVYGTHSTDAVTKTGKHRSVVWDLGRTKLVNSGANTQARRDENYHTVIGKSMELVPEVDLTTLWANTTSAVAGGMSWDGLNAGAVIPTNEISNAVSPVVQVNRMLSIANDRAGCEAIYMAPDAYSWYLKDLNENYTDLANKQMNTNAAMILQLMPMVQEIEGLQFKMFVPGTNVPIYVYTGTYVDRETALRERYFPDGYVVCVPSSQYGSIRYGKIMHLGAMYNAQQYWMNYWIDQRSKKETWELHSNFCVYHTDINSVVSWKVCTTPSDIIYY